MSIDLIESDTCLAVNIMPGDLIQFSYDDHGEIVDEIVRVEVVGTGDNLVLVTGVSEIEGGRDTWELNPDMMVSVLLYD